MKKKTKIILFLAFFAAIFSTITTGSILLFLQNKNSKKLVNKNFDIKKAQEIIENKLKIEYYYDHMYNEIKKEILDLINDVNVLEINTVFDINTNLFLNIEISVNNKIYILKKQLKYWTLQDLNKIFEYDIQDNNIIISKYKNVKNIESINMPNFILNNNDLLFIKKIKSNTFQTKINEINFSNIDFINLEDNWTTNLPNKLIINLNKNNINFVNKLLINEIWINKLEIETNISFQAHHIYLNNNIDYHIFKLIENNYEIFSILNYDDLKINFTYKNNDFIEINSLISNNELDYYKLFNFLFIDNKKYKVSKWNESSLSNLKAKIIDSSNIILSENALFLNNNYVQKVYLNKDQEIIPAKTFKNCENLTNVLNTNNIKFIYEYSFLNCANLLYFYIPKIIKFISNLAFVNISPYKTRIIYHKVNKLVENKIIYKDNLEPIIEINELAKKSLFIIEKNFIYINSFFDEQSLFNSSIVENNNKFYLIKKINYKFEYPKNQLINIKAPYFTKLISIDQKTTSVNTIELSPIFNLNNLTTHNFLTIKQITLPINTNNFNYYGNCNIVIFKEYSKILNFDYNNHNNSKYYWEIPILVKEDIDEIKLNKWSTFFKNNSSLEIVNKYHNPLIISYLKELSKYKNKIIFNNINQ